MCVYNMESNGALQAILRSYREYYAVRQDGALPLFVAEAEFHAHGEQYYLVRAAKIADIDSNEYVFFAQENELDLPRLQFLQEAAWNEGLSRVHPQPGHRNSDVTLIIIAGAVQHGAARAVRKLSRYKSYRLSFWGWSHFRLLVCDLSSGKVLANRMGSGLRRTVEAALRQGEAPARTAEG